MKMSILLFSLRAVLPILLMIVLGMIIKRFCSKFDVSFFKTLNAFSFRFLLSVSLFYNVYSIEDLSKINVNILLYLMASVFFSMLIGILCSRLFIQDRRQKGVIISSSFRSNQSVIGVSIVQAIGGLYAAEALSFCSLTVGLGVPLFNLLTIVVLSVFKERGENTEKMAAAKVLRSIFTNPLIIGSFGGLICVLLRIPLTQNGELLFSIQRDLPALFSAIGSVAKASSPLMLICLGAMLDFHIDRKMFKQIALGVSLRNIICPGFVFLFAYLLRDVIRLTPVEGPTLISFCASPVAVANVVMVQEMGSDEQLAGHIVFCSSILSILTIFIYISVFKVIGII